MAEEKPQTIQQLENSKKKLRRKLVASARNIIANEVGLSVGVWNISRVMVWLRNEGVDIDFPVFEAYQKAVIETPSGKERLNCSREALRRYDLGLNQTNLEFHDKIIDACFEIIARYTKKE